ncbi:hypothetical protein [Marinilabilia rubra]|uniref:Uncharacterized protein n=1 Tax=Marinilabilia rubra TaxID=2162893 RepID=A0A2U2BAG3_9BACT|nr:hypothetical protein [Marinilabilia rubra]PWE00023.1 hypothetical protein DDZ16_06570 [Marinilabilia rubra]
MEEYKTIRPDISSYLSGLTSEEIENVIQDYHEKELKILDIIEKYGLEQVNISEFRTYLPPALHSENVCPECKAVSWVSHTIRGKLSNPYCPVCETPMFEDFCPENRLRALEFERLRREQEEAEWAYWHAIPPDLEAHGIIDVTSERYESLDFDVKVFLGSLVANAISEDFTKVDGGNLRDFKMYPNKSEIDRILSVLGIEDKGACELFYGFDEKIAKKLLLPEKRLESSIEDQYKLWKKIILDEARELLEFQMSDSGFELKQGEVVDEILSDLLQDYSLGQVYHLIYNAVNSACRFYTKNNNRQYAANAVIYNCRRSRDKFKANGWTLRPYNRPWGCKQSEMSRYFFDSVLQIGEEGFKTRPSIEALTVSQFNFI